MTDKISLKKTLHLFNKESNRLLRSGWEESPLPFKRYLEQIEAQTVIKQYLDDCVANHTPGGFDACGSVEAVTKDYGTVFINFSTDPKEESAEVYLILKEIIAQDIHGHSAFFYGYASGNKFAEKYKGFLDKVVRRLIANIGGYLTMMGIEMGLDGNGSVINNIYGSMQNTQFNQPTNGSTVNSTQTNGLNADNLNTLLDELLTAAEVEIDDEETIEDIRDNVDIVRGQIEGGKPRRGAIRSFLGFIKGVNGGAQFGAAVVQIIEFFNNGGFQFPLPD